MRSGFSGRGGAPASSPPRSTHPGSPPASAPPPLASSCPLVQQCACCVPLYPCSRATTRHCPHPPTPAYTPRHTQTYTPPTHIHAHDAAILRRRRTPAARQVCSHTHEPPPQPLLSLKICRALPRAPCSPLPLATGARRARAVLARRRPLGCHMPTPSLSTRALATLCRAETSCSGPPRPPACSCGGRGSGGVLCWAYFNLQDGGARTRGHTKNGAVSCHSSVAATPGCNTLCPWGLRAQPARLGRALLDGVVQHAAACLRHHWGCRAVPVSTRCTARCQVAGSLQLLGSQHLEPRFLLCTSASAGHRSSAQRAALCAAAADRVSKRARLTAAPAPPHAQIPPRPHGCPDAP